MKSGSVVGGGTGNSLW